MDGIHTSDLPAIVPPDIDLDIFPRTIEHIPDFRILYCHRCKQVCFPSSLSSHLFEIHKIPAAKRRPIIQFCQTLPCGLHDLLRPVAMLRPVALWSRQMTTALNAATSHHKQSSLHVETSRHVVRGKWRLLYLRRLIVLMKVAPSC
jgi:hypothetical protein